MTVLPLGGLGFYSAKTGAFLRIRTAEGTTPEMRSYHCTTQCYLFEVYIFVYLMYNMNSHVQ
jgi:hypothetical protein